MTVFELIGASAWIDWASRSEETRIGLFTTAEKAEEKIKEIKKDKNCKMGWNSFRVVPVEVK